MIRRPAIALAKGITIDRHQRLSARAIDHILTPGGEQIFLDFMVCRPSETDRDVTGIADTVVYIAKRVRGQAKLSVSVEPFVPKPHTPLQGHHQETPGELLWPLSPEF